MALPKAIGPAYVKGPDGICWYRIDNSYAYEFEGPVQNRSAQNNSWVGFTTPQEIIIAKGPVTRQITQWVLRDGITPSTKYPNMIKACSFPHTGRLFCLSDYEDYYADSFDLVSVISNDPDILLLAMYTPVEELVPSSVLELNVTGFTEITTDTVPDPLNGWVADMPYAVAWNRAFHQFFPGSLPYPTGAIQNAYIERYGYSVMSKLITTVRIDGVNYADAMKKVEVIIEELHAKENKNA